MREVPDRRVRAWKPPTYEVADGGKVMGARCGTPNNWGRWGDEDQKGTGNLVTDDNVRVAAGLIRTGRRFALGLPIGSGDARLSMRPDPLHLFMATAGDAVIRNDSSVLSDDMVIMALQGSTQVDGLAHAGAHDLLYNGYWAGVVNSHQGARRLGIQHVSDGFAGRGVMLDVARYLGVACLEPGFAIDSALLDATADHQGTVINPGDIVLVRTGFLERYLTAPAEERVRLEGQPGLADDTIDWLHDHDVVLVGADNEAVQTMATDRARTSMRFHVKAIRDLGLFLAELLDLEDLASNCAEDQIYEGFVVISILPVAYAVGSPINPIFFK